jgi:hypothetical protein
LKPEAVSVLASENIQDEELSVFYRDLMEVKRTLYQFLLLMPGNTEQELMSKNAGGNGLNLKLPVIENYGKKMKLFTGKF